MKNPNEKKRRGSLAAITIRISAAVLALWLLCMAVITLVTINFIYNGVKTEMENYCENMRYYGMFDDMELSEEENPERDAYILRRAMDNGDSVSFWTSYAYYNGKADQTRIPNPLREERTPVKVAVAFYTPEYELICSSGNYMYFSYREDPNDLKSTLHYAYVDLDKLGIVDENAYLLSVYSHAAEETRLTGRRIGAEFIPDKIVYKVWEHWERECGAGWQVLYENPSGVSESAERITVGASAMYYEVGESVWHDGEKYANLRELLFYVVEAVPKDSFPYNLYEYERNSLTQSIKFVREIVYDRTDTEFIEENGHSPVKFFMVAALRAEPLKAAISELLNVYLFTFIAAVLLVLILRRSIKKNFTAPVKAVYKGVTDGWGYVTTSLESKTMWREPYEISRHYRETLDKLRADKNEIARLTAALEYAKEAEEQRRQLSSNIAHELKTPLAVIRSYAEGLQERIAEEKRDKYLEVIVGETERMDEMVLEMLDLSRLEAGKVKLARDVFDLSELARGIFEKLEAAAAARELSISYELLENCLVNADEARISQVIENFASNALRYTPTGGHIRLRTSFALGRTTLAVENTSPPLSEEVLSRVWERFYRADEARSEKSSGLGLAIARSIVELHAGHCSAKNTETGVEFSFTI